MSGSHLGQDKMVTDKPFPVRTGKAKRSELCDPCLSATHRAEDCSLTFEDDPDVAKRLRVIESAVVALTRPNPRGETMRAASHASDCVIPSGTGTGTGARFHDAATSTSAQISRATTRHCSALPRQPQVVRNYLIRECTMPAIH